MHFKKLFPRFTDYHIYNTLEINQKRGRKIADQLFKRLSIRCKISFCGLRYKVTNYFQNENKSLMENIKICKLKALILFYFYNVNRN